MEHAEDAGVYRLRDDLAIIQTVDFFTPIVDDPYTFGRIAVTNALSDIYAMGGRPVTAMNIVCFPIRTMDVKILREILRGGLDQMREAGVLLIGGHSVEDNEPKYGLSVTGVIHPERIRFNNRAKPGDHLILTKPLGTGIVSTALKGGLADAALVNRSVACMTTLNRKAAELMAEMVEIHACTDVTGFGFLGHALEMAEGSGIGMQIRAADVPYFPGIRPFVEEGLVPGGLIRNRTFREKQLDIGPDCPDWLIDILFDPQTAGGLLIALPPDAAAELLLKLHAAGMDEAAIVGEAISAPKGIIRVE
jgi:selenide, water dikinase